ncbi:MAG: NADH-quinone oxidoreductase subunit NuoF [Candidatus Aminicenantes bacterium]|nr:NADH-quinone oxidoreductase subunit NuoF [Candidatus Aminicenantes bacterium]
MIDAGLERKILDLAARYPRREAALLPVLSLLQSLTRGPLLQEDLAAAARLLGVSLAGAFGVRTFYSLYHDRPVGTHHLQVDTSVPGWLAGAKETLRAFEAGLGIQAGGTTPDGLFSLEEVEDLGSSDTAPIVRVAGRLCERVTPERAGVLLDALRSGRVAAWPADRRIVSECGILLGRAARGEPVGLAAYVRDGGYRALAKARSMSPEAIVAEVKASRLRGRGGAGFPAGLKWEVALAASAPVTVVCNADEGEPGTFKDRVLMEGDPHLLIEGLAIAARALGAERGYIYIRGEFDRAAGLLETALAEARAAGWLGAGERVFDLLVHRGAGAYICGEETALLESLEGKRGQPRLRPPYPAERGLFGGPTVVHNVETLACLPFIVGKGAEAFRAIGSADNYGPKIYCVSGRVARPGVYEMPMGVGLEDLIDLAGGATGRMKAVLVGGASSAILTAAEAAGLKLDFDSCRRRGTMLGSGAVVVLDESVSIPALAERTMAFFARESCGACVPCREGSDAVGRLLRRLARGEGTAGDLNLAAALCSGIGGTTLCPLGDAFATAVGSMLAKFRPEFEAGLAGPVTSTPQPA